jgi:small subunit ribosomal protein S15
MAVTKEQKASIVKEYGAGEKNTGSIEVQIALITERIVQLTEHFKIHKKDTNGRRGLLMLVGQRRRLLKYLMRTDLDKYRSLIDKLGIRK